MKKCSHQKEYIPISKREYILTQEMIMNIYKSLTFLDGDQKHESLPNERTQHGSYFTSSNPIHLSRPLFSFNALPPKFKYTYKLTLLPQ